MIEARYLAKGHLNQVCPKVIRKANKLIKTHAHRELKIGVTCNPDRRFKQHSKQENWAAMYLLYGTSSVAYAYELEDRLILKYRDRLVNKRRGGGGPAPVYEDRLFVYMIVR